MWKGNIQMHKNDRALFKLDYMLALVARCIDRIQNLVSGNIRSHQKEQGRSQILSLFLLLSYLTILIQTFSNFVSVEKSPRTLKEIHCVAKI